jgi:prepilin signal peptidase PulO-like enzyme (type II secretory pathway)
VLTAALFIWPPPRLGIVMGLFWLIYFGVIVVIDLEHRLVMHPISLFGMVAGMFSGWQMHGWWQTLAGGAAGFGIFFVIYYLGLMVVRWVNRRRGREITDDDEPMGFGDVMLAGVMGLVLGWPGVIAGVFLAALIGGAAGLVVLVIAVLRRQYHSGLSLPYAPCLALATIYLLYLQ